MSQESYFTDQAVKLERRAGILVSIAAITLAIGMLCLIVGCYQLIATDPARLRLIYGAIFCGLALLPFGIAQVYMLRSHLLRIHGQLQTK
ncbi:MAG TPA: hypothetical protein VGO67_05460 [Verrucomicrobiae bacterium]|jgi:hypothetical protein